MKHLEIRQKYSAARRIGESLFTRFAALTHNLSLSDDANKIKNSEYWKGITVSVTPEILSPIRRIVWEKFSSKNSKFYRESINCHPAISQFLMADISLNIACKELEIAQIAQLNQFFQVLHLVDTCTVVEPLGRDTSLLRTVSKCPDKIIRHFLLRKPP